MEEKGLISVEAPERLIALAIEKGVSVETMEKLLAMRREFRAEIAREEFFRALTMFQSECPSVPKTEIVMDKAGTKVRYHFAPLDKIIAVVKPSLEKYGFSYTFQAKYEENPPAQVVSCTLHHKDGHKETSEFRAPVDPEGYMTEIQKHASALTYAKRYAFCNATGIMTADEDTDAQPTENGNAKPKVETDEMYKMKQVWLDRIRDVMMHEDFPEHVREEASERMRNKVYTIAQLKTYYDNALKVLDKYQRTKAKKDDAPKEEIDALGDEELFNQPLKEMSK